MPRRFVFIINPISGTRNKGLLRKKIEAFALENGFALTIFSSVADGDYTFLKPHIAETGVTDVVIAGGDGTINRVLASLYTEDVQFGLLPAGSGNGLAFAAGLSRNMDEAFAAIKKGQSAWTDAFLINNAFACMLCGVGFDAAVAHAFAKSPKRGLNTYIQKSVQHFFSAQAYTFTLHFQNTILPIEAFVISIANCNQFGNNVTIAPQASLTDGLLDVVIITKQNKLALLWETLKQVRGYNAVQKVQSLNAKAGIIYLQTDGLLIENPMQAPLHLDGDPTESAETLNVQLLKGRFRLIYP